MNFSAKKVKSITSVLSVLGVASVSIPVAFAATGINDAFRDLISFINELFGSVMPELNSAGIHRFLYWIILFALTQYIFTHVVIKKLEGSDDKAKGRLSNTLAAVIATIGAIMTPEDILAFIFNLYAGILSLIFVTFILGLLLWKVYNKEFMKDNPRMKHFTRALLLALCILAMSFVRDLYQGYF